MEKLIINGLAKSVALVTLIINIMPYQTQAHRAHKPDPGSDPEWARTVSNGDGHKTAMQFYYHDMASGDSPTAIQVVAAPGSTQPFTGFGFITMADDPLTVGPDPSSKLVGRAQGLYLGASREELSLVVALTYTFQDGIYNGSSLSILARNPILNPMRELTVVGGTGLFRMARGYALIHTYSVTASGNAIVGYNVTVLH